MLDPPFDVILRDADLDEAEVSVGIGRIDEREEIYVPRFGWLQRL